jgi:MFS family permease
MANNIEEDPETVERQVSTSGCAGSAGFNENLEDNIEPVSSYALVNNSSMTFKEVRIAESHSLQKDKQSRYDFPIWRKHWIIFLAGFAALFSPLSSSIYYPAITTLSHSFSVSIEMINLTITSYMAVSGVGPALVSDLADHIGRRPVYIFTLALYFAVNIGLACQKSYPALLVLRMLQSLGTSGSISLAFGTVSDLWPPAERGRYVGWVTCGYNSISLQISECGEILLIFVNFTSDNELTLIFSPRPNLAPTIGPVLGAVFAEKSGWRWIFWFLAIGSGTCLILFILTFPETEHSARGKNIQPRLFVISLPPFFNIKSHKEFPEEDVEKVK